MVEHVKNFVRGLSLLIGRSLTRGGFYVILGMDVLRQCDFSVDRTGRWQLSFG